MIYKYFKKFFKYNKEYKSEFLGYSALSLVASIMELTGVALVYPFVLTILTKNEIHNFLKSPVIIGVLIILLFLFKNIFMIYFINLQAKFVNKLGCSIKEKIMTFFLYSVYQDTYKISLAEKSKIFGLLVDTTMNNFILRLLNLSINIFIFIMISMLLAIKYPLAMFLTVLFAITLVNIQNRIYKPMLVKAANKVSETSLVSNQAYNEAVLNLKEIKISNNENYFYQNYKDTQKEYFVNLRRLSFLSQIPPFVTEPFSIILLFVLLVIISFQTYLDPEKLIASFALIASAIFRLAPTIARIQVNFNGINAALPLVKEFVDLFEKYEINEKSKTLNKPEILPLKDCIELKNISFGYDKNKNILSNVNLKISKGEFIGIAGESGVGKTTLVDIIAGLFLPTSGQFLIDGADKQGILNIGYIPQEFKLIKGSIRENVAFGNPVIDDDRVIDSLKKSQLYDFVISNYKEGIYADPFSDSAGFSIGQKQRLAIARALYSNPEILILDEATSSLDLKTENEICNVLNQLKGQKTIIVIAHRLSTIKNADRIVYMENGTTSAIGDFDYLYNNSKSFRYLVEIFNNKKFTL